MINFWIKLPEFNTEEFIVYMRRDTVTNLINFTVKFVRDINSLNFRLGILFVDKNSTINDTIFERN